MMYVFTSMYSDARASRRYRSSGSLRRAYILSMALVNTSKDSARAAMTAPVAVAVADIAEEDDDSEVDNARMDSAALLLLMHRDSFEAGLGMNSWLPTKVYPQRFSRIQWNMLCCEEWLSMFLMWSVKKSLDTMKPLLSFAYLMM